MRNSTRFETNTYKSPMENKSMSREVTTFKRAFYDNPTGPGDYELQSTIGSKSVLGQHQKKAPGYSIQGKNKLPYFKGCDIELMGAGTPSAGIYDPSHSLIKEQA